MVLATHVTHLVVECDHRGTRIPQGVRLHVARVDARGLGKAAGEVAAVVPQPSRAWPGPAIRVRGRVRVRARVRT